MTRPPTHDRAGLHILDPRDELGHKSEYITRLQEKCLRTHLPRGNGGVAVDVGCGFGRLTPILSELGWETFGVDPSKDLLAHAREHYPGPKYIEGALPDLPFSEGEVSLILLQNVLRPLHLMGQLHSLKGIGAYVRSGGYAVVVDNIWAGNPEFMDESRILSLMEAEGFSNTVRIPFRAARWWLLYLIRYGIVPKKFFDRIAEHEMEKMRARKRLPSCQYSNVLYMFEKL